MSWNDGVAFCRWLSKAAPGVFRLPTEAEWEHACRASSTTAYPWSDDPDGGAGWLNGPDSTAFPDPNVKLERTWSQSFNFEDGYWFVSPVGTFRPNVWGLYDMLGNVWEWCGDQYRDYPDAPETDPVGASSSKRYRVIRGGSWAQNAMHCRSANRNRLPPKVGTPILGFRVCRDK